MASILLIDDDNDLRAVLAMALTAKGHTVSQAADGDEGIRHYRKNQAEIVITDVIMPEKEGLAVIIELRKINPQVGIIAISGGFGDNSKLYLNLASKLGADMVLRKPFLPAEMNAAVDTVLNRPEGAKA